MWNSDTKIFFKENLNLKKKELLDKLLFEISIPKIGIAIVFDNNDYSDYPNPLWRNQGLHLNIKLDDFEYESPDHLLDIMESKKFSNLIWISNRICRGDLIQFAWVISHEFQHFVQDRICHTVSLVNWFMIEWISNNPITIEEPKKSLSIPYEFNAEIAAYKMAIQFFGKPEAERYIRSPRNDNNLITLLKYDLTQPYDVVAETVQFLNKYKNQIEDYVKKASNPYVRSFNVKNALHNLRKCLDTLEM